MKSPPRMRVSARRSLLMAKILQILSHQQQYKDAKISVADVIDKASVAFGWKPAEAQEVLVDAFDWADDILRATSK